MVLNMKQILEDMGWSGGYHIPVANAENLQLEAEVERLSLAKAKATVIFETISSKCSALENHMKYITTEQEENQSLLMARHSQLEAEKNLYILAKMERDRLTQDIKQIEKNYEKTETRKNAKRTDLNNLIEKLDKLKLSVEYDEQLVENWEEDVLKKSDDNNVLKKFSEEDKKKAKDLEVKRQKLQEEENTRRQLVIRTSKEIDSMELIVTRNVQLYKQMHEERSNLVRQWQDAVRQLQQRDKETLALNREILSTKELNEAKLEVLEQEKEFYRNECNNNKELETLIEQTNFEIVKLKRELEVNLETTKEYLVELETMKSELKKTADLLENERMIIKKMNKELKEKSRALEKMIIKVYELKVQEKNVIDSKMDSQERAKTLEDIIKTEEHIHKALLTDVENMQIAFFRAQQTLNDVIDISTNKALEMRGLEQENVLLEKEKQQVEKDLLLQKEHMYKLEYRLSLLSAKLTRLTGDAEDTFTEEDEIKLNELEAKSAEVLELNNLLQVQINRVEDVMRHVTNFIQSHNDKLYKLHDTLQNQVLMVEKAMKQVSFHKTLNQQLQVEENIVKVKLKHSEKTLKQEGTHIFNLQKQQIELENTLRERESEIDINKTILTAKKASLNEDNNRMKMDIQGRRIKIENFKKRLDGILATIGKTDDGEPVSVAYFKVKNAQDKYILQEEGDKLDHQIRKAEKEIIAMENTLKAINFTNDYYRKSLSVVNENDEEIQEMKEIEKQLYNETREMRKYRNELIAQQEKLQKTQELLDVKEKEMAELQEQLNEKEKEYVQLDNEAQHRRNKLERAENQIKKLMSKRLDKNQRKDFITRQIQECNKSVILQLTDATSQHIETKPNVQRYFSENNLAMSVSTIRSSSRSCSTMSLNSTASRSTLSCPSVNLTLDKSTSEKH